MRVSPFPFVYQRRQGPRELTLKRDHFEIGSADGQGIALVFSAWGGEVDDGHARLFAAAPELLALAERVAYTFENHPSVLGEAARAILGKVKLPSVLPSRMSVGRQDIPGLGCVIDADVDVEQPIQQPAPCRWCRRPVKLTVDETWATVDCPPCGFRMYEPGGGAAARLIRRWNRA